MIEHIAPKISKEHAQNLLHSPPGFFKKKRHIERVELFYLPSFVVEVRVTSNKQSTTQSFCIDAVLGSFAFFDSTTETGQSPHIQTCPFVLNENAVQEKALDEYRRHLLRTGLKMRYTFQIDDITNTRATYYPFWIGYHKQKGKIDFDVIDAVGGEHQGAAMRPVFIKALLDEIKITQDQR